MAKLSYAKINVIVFVAIIVSMIAYKKLLEGRV